MSSLSAPCKWHIVPEGAFHAVLCLCTLKLAMGLNVKHTKASSSALCQAERQPDSNQGIHTPEPGH